MGRIVPLGEPRARSSVTIPKRQWKALDAATTAENADREADMIKPLSRDDVLAYLLDWALEQWESERVEKKSKR
jgi:hypothetical protein